MTITFFVAHRPDDLEKAIYFDKASHSVLHRIDDLEIGNSIGPASTNVLHRIDDLEKETHR
ncbi:Uncharacterised protein [Acinetobacter baumannii]|uniref:Uncharacterized protein n=1 Tax=Acinetobacter baumannii (strain ATCC 19606 / DSM 30007 / JCM 6841 / CCUG 19606 / CIP 70.34 / NBRC 109757 / NCIMB 12457 / NCTC 12156 / 81) TaxID=575584 RepID=D0C9V9_ACIB2|nr:hypothetical protein HMPREF0010_01422 [Acinetobacter baumannii ATCC 19606 = CIP 70.34 = JCM 6841]EME59642.1 hypothetical protein G347_03030 [Acinetobacter baumannii MSP4-16]SSQ13357.1 Uncharacterised protein [Acinetobacter baumannii]ENW73632.1 hypothetical protein F911_03045 [Acinetobacter baumannii ATCC 19606 = CIP 70.34 = JCM 6841]KFC04083.1 hypothetical protein DJ41_2645 [Acinetobacter baumannii ATCC 19606 = CIP 70.34 = JCM 6841]